MYIQIYEVNICYTQIYYLNSIQIIETHVSVYLYACHNTLTINSHVYTYYKPIYMNTSTHIIRILYKHMHTIHTYVYIPDMTLTTSPTLTVFC